MPGSARILLVLLALAFASCGGENQNRYAEAAIGAGIAVAAVAVHRAATNDCWGRCSPGYICNEESGFCERGECLPVCAVGTHCIRDSRALPYCAPDPGLTDPPKSQQVMYPQRTPAQSLPQPTFTPN